MSPPVAPTPPGQRLLRPALGLAVGAVVVAVVAIAPWLAWPTVEAEPARVVIAPTDAARADVCAGDLLASGRDATSAAGLSVAAPQAVVRAVGADSDPATDDPVLLSSDASGSSPTAWMVTGGEAVSVAGSAAVADEDLFGFAASACRVPLLDSWLVGGAGTTGAADLVLLSNPGEVAATVTLTVYGATGPEVPPGGAQVVVPAGTQRVLPLAGLALGQESPVLHVQASGAPVAASLQTSITRTLVPGGVDQGGVQTELSTQLLFPGVAVVAAGAGAASGEAPTVVRLLAPTASGVATVTVRSVGGAEPSRAPTVVDLSAGVPVAVGVPDLGVGTWVIEVAADVPVAAAVWQATGFGAASDFAWHSPAPVIAQGAGAIIAVPTGPSPALTLVNPGGADAEVTLSPGGGAAPSTLSIPAGASLEVPLQAAVSYTLTGDPVHAAVHYSAPSALAAFPVWPQDAGAEPIVVYP